MTSRPAYRCWSFPRARARAANRSTRFKGGFALIAKRAGVPIQTVFIETDNPFLSKGWPLLKKPTFPLVYRVRLGQAFHRRRQRARVRQAPRAVLP